MNTWAIVISIVVISFSISAHPSIKASESELKKNEKLQEREDANMMEENVTEEDTMEIEDDPCQSMFCRTGRKCEVDKSGRARCVCGGEDHCKGHQSQVCGSDSKMYPSHCELHRISCLEKSRLGMDHTGRRCRSHETVKPSSSPIGFSTFDTEKPSLLPTSTTKTKPSNVAVGELCSAVDYKNFKINLIHYHCARTGNNGCMSDRRKKISAVAGMFESFDGDSNKLLTISELDFVEAKNHIDRLSKSCHLKDLIWNDGNDADQIIGLGEFYKAFGLDSSHLTDDSPSIYTTLVSVGNAVELKCDIPQSKKVVWKRSGRLITSSDEMKIFEDNSLYIGVLNLHHIGNYSCHDVQNDASHQTHVIIVQMPPVVKVYPASQSQLAGSTVAVKCHVSGVPQPEIIWKKDGVALSSEQLNTQTRFLQLYSNTSLKIKSTDSIKDSGIYSCEATNSAGSASQSASVTFTTPKANYNPSDTRQMERFAVFHDSGYTVYELINCHVEHHVFAEFKLASLKYKLPGMAQETLCSIGKSCSWGESLIVAGSLLYVTQPEYKRILVVEVTDRLNPIEVIQLKAHPKKIKYLEHLDQLWLTTCSSFVDDCPDSNIKVIYEAAKNVQHQATYANQDVINRNIENIFLPAPTNLKDHFNRGYVTTKVKSGSLGIIDLFSTKFVGEVDLSEYQCSAKDVAYVPIGGYLFISCQPFSGTSEANFHLILDYVTHSVLKKSDVGGGNIFVSPDSRFVVILERNGSIISVYKLTADGRLNHLFDEYTQMHLNHLGFFASENGVGYNAFAVSSTQNTVLHIELLSGKVTMIEGAEGAFSSTDVMWSQTHRKIVSGGEFFEHLMTSSRTSIIGLDGQRKRIQCHWQNVNNTSTFVALPLEYQ